MNKEQIISSWEIGEVKSIEIINSFRNKVRLINTQDDNKYILKEKENPEKIKREAALLSYLRGNIPVAVPIMTKDRTYFVLDEDKYYVLYPFLAGESITDCYSDDFRKKANLLGRVIGELHYFIKKVDFKECQIMNLISDVSGWAKNIIEENKKHFDHDFLLKIMTGFEKEVIPIYDLLPTQIIHRDIHPDNILIKDKKLSGIIDFELFVKGVRIFDPCYCATSILIKGFNDEENRLKWPEIFGSLLKGYTEKNKFTVEEITCIINVLYSIQLIFMAFSCTVDNIEAAKHNERVLKWLYTNRKMIEKIIIISV